jgi:hypothetical protein
MKRYSEDESENSRAKSGRMNGGLSPLEPVDEGAQSSTAAQPRAQRNCKSMFRRGGNGASSSHLDDIFEYETCSDSEVSSRRPRSSGSDRGAAHAADALLMMTGSTNKLADYYAPPRRSNDYYNNSHINSTREMQSGMHTSLSMPFFAFDLAEHPSSLLPPNDTPARVAQAPDAVLPNVYRGNIAALLVSQRPRPLPRPASPSRYQQNANVFKDLLLQQVPSLNTANTSNVTPQRSPALTLFSTPRTIKNTSSALSSSNNSPCPSPPPVDRNFDAFAATTSNRALHDVALDALSMQPEFRSPQRRPSYSSKSIFSIEEKASSPSKHSFMQQDPPTTLHSAGKCLLFNGNTSI